MVIEIKRIYDEPKKTDGVRVLIDRLWPRGISKTDAHIKLWAKEATPTNTLRTWFHKNPEDRWQEFQKLYRAELKEHKAEIFALFRPLKGRITLITAVKNPERSHAPILKKFLDKTL